MKHKYAYAIVLFCIISTSIAFNSSVSTTNTLMVSATISGTTTVCQNTGTTNITFTGSGGTAPYTFTYTINNGANQTISTNGNNNSISLAVNTNNIGTFTYNLISVEDDLGEIENVSGNAVITIIESPDGTMGGTGSGTTFEGVPVFRQCSNTTSDFVFTNTSTTTATNINYNISWGDSSPDFNQSNWSSTTHTYAVGIYNLVYTIEGSNGCITTTNYTVFVGSNPAVSLGNPGNTDICNSSPLTFPITGTENNPPGTTYTVTFNDGSTPQVFNHPPPASVTHTFDISSCNTTSSDGTNTYQNSFSAIIVASNPCSTSSVGVVPIYVSIAPEADFTSPETACTNTQVCLINDSIGEENNGSGSTCDTSPNIIWNISPNTGYTITSGTLGNDFGQSDPSLWATGSDNLCLNFTQGGTYTITLDTGNRCGSDTMVKTICVEDDLTPIFTTNLLEGCTLLNITTNNLTDETNSCEPPTYLWEVDYSSDYCGTSPEIWNFTNGTNENSLSPSFNFETPGVYTINLTATNSCGDFTTSQDIIVKQPPTASINSIPDFCGLATINPTAIINNCTNDSSSLSYNWNFSGGIPATSSLLNPGSINYNAPGDYTVTLTVTNDCGTSTVATQDFTIGEIPQIINTDLTQIICSGTSTEEIILNSTLPNTNYTWSASASAGVTGFISNGTSNTIPAQIISTSNNFPGTLTYSVTPSINNCDGDTVNFIITINPAPELTTQPQGSEVCQNGTANELSVTLADNSGNPQYQWYVSDTNNYSGTLIPSANSSTYNPPTDVIGEFYYYCIVSFDPGGCDTINSQIAHVIITPTISIETQPINSQSICVNSTIENPLSISHTGGTGNITYQWYSNTINSNSGGTLISGATNATYTPPIYTSTGTYFYYVIISIDGSGCDDIDSEVTEIIVVDNPTITTQPIQTQTLCQGATPENLTVTATGGLGAFAYQWYSNTSNNNSTGTIIPGATNNSYTPNTSTVGTLYYYCIITQPTSPSCSVTSNTSEIIITPAPTISTQPTSSSVCINGTPNELNVDYINGTGTPTYQWYIYNLTDNLFPGTEITGANSSNYTPSTNTVGNEYYYCIISFPPNGGCDEVSSDPALVEVVENVSINSNPIQETICVGGNSSELNYSFSGGTGDILFQWYFNSNNSYTDGTEITGANNANYTPPTFNTTGIFYYYLEIDYNGNGCDPVLSEISSIIVVNDPVASIQPDTPQVLCENATSNTLTANATGGIGNDFTYQWYSNTNNDNTSGTIIVNETNNTFTPPTNLIGTLYYYCIVTQPHSGCIDTTETVSITINPAPTFNTQPISETICLGDNLNDLSVSVSNGAGIPTYQWYVNTIDDDTNGTPINNSNTNIITPTNGTVGTLYYYCTVTFNSGDCPVITSNTAQITINQVPVISNFTDLICSDNAFSISPNNTNGDIVPNNTTYTWSTPNVSPIGSINGAIEELTPQNVISQNLVNLTTDPSTVTYTITPTSGDCIGNPFTVVVTVNPSISVTSNLTNSPCYLDNGGAIEIDIIGGVPFTNGNLYNISWNGPNGFTSNSEDISNLEPGDYTVTINDAGGCPYSQTFTIDEPDELILLSTDTHNDISCFGETDGEIALNISGGTEPYSYEWLKDNVVFSNEEDISGLASGIYELTITDANNCLLVIPSYEIIEPPLLTVNLLNKTDIDCFGQNTGAVDIEVNGGRPDYSFSWTGPNGYVNNNQNISNLFAGDYTVTVIDSSQCVETLNVTIIQNDEIIPDITVSEITCYNANNGSITINNIVGGVSPYTIEWSNFGSGMIQDNLSPGTYTISITDSLDCTIAVEIILENAPEFAIYPETTPISCFGEDDASISLNLVGGINPVTVIWDDDPTAGVDRNNLPPGTYSVTITDGTPCYINYQHTVLPVNELIVSATVIDALDCDNVNSGAIDLSITGGTAPYTISWSNGSNDEDLLDIPPNTYSVSVVDARNCEVNGVWEVIRFDPLTLNVDTETIIDCENQDIDQIFTAIAEGGVPPYQFNWSSGIVSGINNENMTTEQNGLVILEVTDSYGCITSYSHNVDIPEIGDVAFYTNSIGYSTYGIYSILDPIQFTNEATGDYINISWDFGDGNFSNEENPIHTYTSEGTYTITQTVTYEFGCIYTHIISLTLEKGYSLMMPNAFTPNQDGINDFFGPEFIGLHGMRLDIYDTWGSLIYSEEGDDIIGWDGMINDTEAENGNYYFNFTALTFYNKTVEEHGSFVYIK